MKKILAIIGVAIAIVFSSHAQQTVPAIPALVANTNTTVVVSPVTLTADQVDGIIQAVEGLGVSCNVPITSTNLQMLVVRRVARGTNVAFTVMVRIQ